MINTHISLQIHLAILIILNHIHLLNTVWTIEILISNTQLSHYLIDLLITCLPAHQKQQNIIDLWIVSLIMLGLWIVMLVIGMTEIEMLIILCSWTDIIQNIGSISTFILYFEIYFINDTIYYFYIIIEFLLIH